ncbi:MAG: hypothetical protein HDT14_05230 [Oscillibacter sp.]|nr:hypothetical protein [Oscillibacter sp.]
MSSLQPLYDVKERLEAAAIAGVGLLDEDFRLRRAAEAMKPLAAASPVFGRISAGLEQLLAAPPKERAGLLLDTLALVDAVAYTQGKSGMEGELIPLPAGCGTCLSLSHGQLSPLLNALTGTGGRREAVVRLAWENHPEFFRDFRVLPALIAGLGDSSGGMADQNAGILKQLGPSVVPLLKENFDPRGKRAMARRVEVIDAIAGGRETEWFLAQLTDAGRDVRAPLIYTLRHSEENFERIKTFCKSEKGECQEKAIQAMVCLTGPAAAAYTRELAKKKPETVLQALSGSDNPLHGDLIADLMGMQLDKIFAKDAPNWGTVLWQGLEALFQACLGKDSPAMLELYRELAAWYAGERSRWKSNLSAFQNRRNVTQLAPFLGRDGKWPLPAGLLSASIWRNPSPALRALAEELAEKYGWLYYEPLVLAAGLTESPAAVWERFAPMLEPDACTRNQRLGILFGLGLLTGRVRGRPFLDSRWAAALMSLPLVPIGGDVPLWRASGYKNNTWVYTAAPLEIALCALDPADSGCAAAFRENLEKIQPQPGVSVDYMVESLRYREWADWKGMIPMLTRASGERISPLDLERWYREYVGGRMTNGEKIAELEWFREEVRARRFKVFVTWSEARIQQVIDSLK